MRTLIAFATRNPMAAALGIFLLLALAGGAKLKWDLWGLERAHHEATTERDSLAAEAAAERARAEGWEVRFAEREEDMDLFLAAKGDTISRLKDDLQASQVEMRSFARALLVAEGRLTSVGIPDSASPGGAVGDSATCPSRWGWGARRRPTTGFLGIPGRHRALGAGLRGGAPPRVGHGRHGGRALHAEYPVSRSPGDSPARGVRLDAAGACH